MSDREGVSPTGGAPERSPRGDAPPGVEPVAEGPAGVEPVAEGPPGVEPVDAVASGAVASGAVASGVEPGDAGTSGVEPADAGAAAASATDDTADEVPADAPVEAPAEPTLRADPAVREFEVPFDTGQLHTLPTGQLLVVHRPELRHEASAAVEEDTQRRVYSWVAAVVGIIGAAASLFVGWMLPLSIAAIVFGVLGLRREEEGRNLAFVGIGTGIAGLVFAAVWIGYYAIVFGALPH